jgi:thiol-disulfide isomerase/thioredoxin
MIDLVRSGQKEALRAERADDEGSGEIAALPQFALTDLEGKPLTAAEAAGRVVVVEFWATWCPPCRSTLKWLGEVKKKHGDRVAVLALAVESQEPDVRKMAGEYSRDVRWAIATPEVVQAFGDVVSVPTLLVFDRSGKTASVFYGAPADLHQKAEQLIESLLR